MAGKVSDQLARRCNTPEQALGTVMTELRLKRRWGYQYVAHRVGCSENYMNEMELGKRNPTFGMLQAIAHLHGLKLSQLLALGERKHERRSRKKKR